MKVAVVFYSRFGHTRIIAQEIARELGATLREIQSVKEHSWAAMGFGAVFGIPFKLRPMNLDFTPFDLVVLCTPIWAGRPACPTLTFARQARLERKRVAICLSTFGSGIDSALARLKSELAATGAGVDVTTHILTRDDVPEEKLRSDARDFARKLAGAEVGVEAVREHVPAVIQQDESRPMQ